MKGGRILLSSDIGAAKGGMEKDEKVVIVGSYRLSM